MAGGSRVFRDRLAIESTFSLFAKGEEESLIELMWNGEATSGVESELSPLENLLLDLLAGSEKDSVGEMTKPGEKGTRDSESSVDLSLQDMLGDQPGTLFG